MLSAELVEASSSKQKVVFVSLLLEISIALVHFRRALNVPTVVASQASLQLTASTQIKPPREPNNR